jgi:hypothetical protein
MKKLKMDVLFLFHFNYYYLNYFSYGPLCKNVFKAMDDVDAQRVDFYFHN